MRQTGGIFITLEGGEGTGKSTLARGLEARLQALGRKVRLTREPGGCAEAEAVRGVFVGRDDLHFPARAEAMLMSAARAAHLDQVIAPELDQGTVVVCDRFIDSTRVYQGIVGGVDSVLISALEVAAIAGHAPDLTLVLDMPPEIAIARALARGDTSRFDRAPISFHHAVRAGFLAIASAEPTRCVVIDASGDSEEVLARALAVVVSRLDDA